MRKSAKKSNRNRGFSYLELMITALLSLILAGVIGDLSRSHRHHLQSLRGDLLMMREGRMLFHFLANDFSQAQGILMKSEKHLVVENSSENGDVSYQITKTGVWRNDHRNHHSLRVAKFVRNWKVQCKKNGEAELQVSMNNGPFSRKVAISLLASKMGKTP